MSISNNEDWRRDNWKIQDFHATLLDSGKFGDVVFLVGAPESESEAPKRITAHKFILSMRSPIFEIMFGEHWGTQGQDDKVFALTEIKIPDAEPGAFMAFLKFLYSDIFVSTIEGAADLLYLGNKYNVTSLVVKCADFLSEKMNSANVIGIYRIAIMFDQDILRATALAYILLGAGKVFKEEEFLTLEIDLLSEIIQCDDLNISEIELFGSIMRWAKAELKRQDLPECPNNMRKLIEGKLLPHIRFLQMTVEDFSLEVAQCGILTEKETVLIFQHFSVKNPTLKAGLSTLPFNLTPRHYNPAANKLNPTLTRLRFCAMLYLSSTVCSRDSVKDSYFGKNGWIHTENLEFCTDKHIEILGIGLFGPGQQTYINGEIQPLLSTYEVEVILFEFSTLGGYYNMSQKPPQRNVLARVKRIVSTRSDYEVLFTDSRILQPRRIYHIMLTFKGDETQHGVTRLTSTKVKANDTDVTFQFIKGFGRNTILGHNDSPGRIRYLAFKKPEADTPFLSRGVLLSDEGFSGEN